MPCLFATGPCTSIGYTCLLLRGQPVWDSDTNVLRCTGGRVRSICAKVFPSQRVPRPRRPETRPGTESPVKLVVTDPGATELLDAVVNRNLERRLEVVHLGGHHLWCGTLCDATSGGNKLVRGRGPLPPVVLVKPPHFLQQARTGLDVRLVASLGYCLLLFTASCHCAAIFGKIRLQLNWVHHRRVHGHNDFSRNQQ